MRKFLFFFLFICFVPILSINSFYLDNSKNYLVLNWHEHFCSYLNRNSIKIVSSTPEQTILIAEIIIHDFETGSNIGWTNQYLYNHKLWSVQHKLLTYTRYDINGTPIQVVDNINSLYSSDTSKSPDIIYFEKFKTFFYPEIIKINSDKYLDEETLLLKYRALSSLGKETVTAVINTQIQNQSQQK